MNKIHTFSLLFIFLIFTSCNSSSDNVVGMNLNKGLIIDFTNNKVSQDVVDSHEGILIKKNGENLSLSTAYISLQDVKNKTTEKFEGGFYKLNNNKIQQIIDLPNNAGKISVNYVVHNAMWSINATVESFSQENKGWKLRLHIPFFKPENEWVWETGPNSFISLDNLMSSGNVPSNASWYPLTSLTSTKGGMVFSVPVTKPAVISFLSSANEIVAEFSLGTSKLTKEANTASVTMEIWATDMNGGFREALQSYYDRHSTYFSRIVEKSGLWATGTPERLKVTTPFYFHEHGNIFFSNEDSSAREIKEQIEIDKEYDLATLPYLHIGQMSRIKLSELPDNNINLNEFLSNQNLTVSPQQFSKYETLYPDKALRKWNDALALSSTLTSELNPNVKIRETITNAIGENGEVLWAWDTIGKQVSFVINPDPDIVSNGVNGHGKNVLEWLKIILEKYPEISGIYVDSLSGWSKFRNYNNEHFKYSSFPLASDEMGNVYLPNAWGHVKFLLKAKEILHAKNKILMGNSYEGGVDHFFVSSMVDVLGNEDQNDVNQTSLFGRTVSGIRPLLRLSPNVHKLDDKGVKKFINSSLALGILPSSWGSYFSKQEWINYDESFSTGIGGLARYSLHEKHWLRVFNVLENYSQMTWIPITGVATMAEGVHLERFATEKNNGMLVTLYRKKPSITDLITLKFDNLTSGKINKNIKPIDMLNNKELDYKVVGDELSLDVKLDKTESSLSVLFIDTVVAE